MPDAPAWPAMRLPAGTDRLAFAALAADDAAFLVELLNDPDFLRHIGDRGVRDEASARDYLAKGPWASYAAHGFGLWRIGPRDGGPAWGLCGLLQRPDLPAPDVGYALLPAARGRGLAREAVAATLAHAFGPLALPRVLAIVSPGNVASVRLLEGLGLARTGDHEGGNGRVQLHALEAAAWRAAQTGVGLR